MSHFLRQLLDNNNPSTDGDEFDDNDALNVFSRSSASATHYENVPTTMMIENNTVISSEEEDLIMNSTMSSSSSSTMGAAAIITGSYLLLFAFCFVVPSLYYLRNLLSHWKSTMDTEDQPPEGTGGEGPDENSILDLESNDNRFNDDDVLDGVVDETDPRNPQLLQPTSLSASLSPESVRTNDIEQPLENVTTTTTTTTNAVNNDSSRNVVARPSFLSSWLFTPSRRTRTSTSTPTSSRRNPRQSPNRSNRNQQQTQNPSLSTSQRATLRKKYLEERRGQLRHLMSPYKLVLTEANFPPRSVYKGCKDDLNMDDQNDDLYVFEGTDEKKISKQIQSGKEEVMENTTAIRFIDTTTHDHQENYQMTCDGDNDDATTSCTHESNSTHPEDDTPNTESNIQRKTNRKKRNTKHGEMTMVVVVSDSTGQNQQMEKETFKEEAESILLSDDGDDEDVNNQIDISENPYGEEDSCMIQVPVAGLSHYSYLLHEKEQQRQQQQQQQQEKDQINQQAQQPIHCTNGIDAYGKNVVTTDEITVAGTSSTRPGNTTNNDNTAVGDIESLSSQVQQPVAVDENNNVPKSDTTNETVQATSTETSTTVTNLMMHQCGFYDVSDPIVSTSRFVSGLCTICLSTFEVGDEVTYSSNPQCDHVFHSECIEQWIFKQKSEPLCPCCRQDFILDPFEQLLQQTTGTTTSSSAESVENDNDIISSTDSNDSDNRATVTSVDVNTHNNEVTPTTTTTEADNHVLSVSTTEVDTNPVFDYHDGCSTTRCPLSSPPSMDMTVPSEDDSSDSQPREEDNDALQIEEDEVAYYTNNITSMVCV